MLVHRMKILALLVASAAAALTTACQKGSGTTSASTSAASSGLGPARVEALVKTAKRRDGYGSGGRCYAQVYYAMLDSGFSSNGTLDRWGIGYGGATDFGNLSKGAYSDMQISLVGSSSHGSERGDIIVYPAGVCGAHSRWGHIEINIGGNRACSDFCGAIRTCNSAKVYRATEAAVAKKESAPASSPASAPASAPARGWEDDAVAQTQGPDATAPAAQAEPDAPMPLESEVADSCPWDLFKSCAVGYSVSECFAPYPSCNPRSAAHASEPRRTVTSSGANIDSSSTEPLFLTGSAARKKGDGRSGYEEGNGRPLRGPLTDNPAAK